MVPWQGWLSGHVDRRPLHVVSPARWQDVLHNSSSVQPQVCIKPRWTGPSEGLLNFFLTLFPLTLPRSASDTHLLCPELPQCHCCCSEVTTWPRNTGRGNRPHLSMGRGPKSLCPSLAQWPMTVPADSTF